MTAVKVRTPFMEGGFCDWDAAHKGASGVDNKVLLLELKGIYLNIIYYIPHVFCVGKSHVQ